jgi:hypothetical protein
MLKGTYRVESADGQVFTYQNVEIKFMDRAYLFFRENEDEETGESLVASHPFCQTIRVYHA